jgi:hypothetical protein
MSELPPPEPTFRAPPGRSLSAVWGTMASAMLHAGLLVLLVWQPPQYRADAGPVSAIDVVIVPPPEADSASEPVVEEEPQEDVPEEEAPEEAPAEEPDNPTPEEGASAATPPPPEPPPAEAPPAPSAAPAAAAAPSSPEPPSEPAAPQPVAEAAAPEPAQPAQGAGSSSEKVAPIPLARPAVRGLTAPESGSEAVVAVTGDAGETAEATAPPAPSAEPDVTTLELGALRSAERFYFKELLDVPSMAQARATLETLPPERRLAQTCILEALAQVGNAGEGYTPDVVMAEAYAKAEMTGTRLAASGAIFRSGENWYGLAFDCTLSDDLTDVAAFSYRLGADVTEAVLARLNKT